MIRMDLAYDYMENGNKNSYTRFVEDMDTEEKSVVLKFFKALAESTPEQIRQLQEYISTK